MSHKPEGTMHITKLGLLATLSVLTTCMAHAARVSTTLTDHNDARAEATTVVTTITTSMTRTVTSTRILAASPAPDEMRVGGKEYQLQGCFGQGEIETMAMVLGTEGIQVVPKGAAGGAADASNMTLSICLKLCGSAVTRANESYPYIGVSYGDSCYCGTALNATAPQAASAHNCTLPCRGNNTEACGGTNFMSVYKLVPSRAGVAAQSKFAGGGDISSNNDNNNNNNETDSRGARSGITAGIAVGSISGFGVVLFLIFLSARWCTRRRQAQEGVRGMQRRREIATSTSTISVDTTRDTPSADTTTISTTTFTSTSMQDEKAIIRDATRIDLRRLDGVVMDEHASPRIGLAASTTASAATTGAQWRNSGSSPLTPRTPRHVDGSTTGLETRGYDTLSTTKPSSMVLHPPNTIAPTHGLGERAWHRRRLSIPFPPPAGGSDGPAADGDGTKGETRRDDRHALPSQRPAENNTAATAAAAKTDRVGGYEGDEAVSALTADGQASSPSWRWTISTTESGDLARDSGDDDKAGKVA